MLRRLANRSNSPYNLRACLSSHCYLVLIAIGLLLVMGAYTMHTSLAASLLQTPEQELRQIWRTVGDTGRYDYDSTVLQTINPTPRLENVGRQPQTDQLFFSGKMDSHAEAMELTMELPNQPSMEIKVADGISYGRLQQEEEWRELEEGTELFAPGGDPMGFLSAMENVRIAPVDPNNRTAQDGELFPAGLLPTEMAAAMTRYAFDLDGLAYAEYMRQSMETHLRARGELPAGMTLGHVEQYKMMMGQGEVWVDGSSMPVRQIIHISFPPEKRAKEWVEAKITTDFSNWGVEKSATILSQEFWQDPQQILRSPAEAIGLSSAEAQQIGYMVGLLLLLIGLAALIITHRRSQLVRVPIVGAIIVSMIVTPLLQTQQVSAFYDMFEGRQPQAEADQGDLMESGDDSFDPFENPLASSVETTPTSEPQRLAMAQPAANEAATTTTAQAVSNAATTAVAMLNCTITETSDCDGDGLTDQIELFELGTWIDNVDTDGDGLSDWAEVQPATIGGVDWYLDPRNPDTNLDGLSDGAECADRNDVDLSVDGLTEILNGSGANGCPDTDGDGTPDFYDFDNDNDSVPDSVDTMPDTTDALDGESFEFTLANAQEGHGVLVDLQIRPKNPEHLWWVNNVLNWPPNDTQGQIQRVRADEEGNNSGDIVLSPVLEVTIPWDDTTKSRNLPISSTVNRADITMLTPLDEWLDTDTLNKHGITASLDGSDGSVVLYVPVTQVLDPVGRAPVAFSGRILYEMGASGGWTDAHQVRLLWLVNMQTDSCTESTEECTVEYPENYLSTSTVVQTYYDEFVVTGISKQENHGAKAVVIGGGGSTELYDQELWHVATTLQETYLKGYRRQNGTVRFDLASILNRVQHNKYTATDLSTVLVTDNNSLDGTVGLAEQMDSAWLASTLDDFYPDPSNGDIGNLLFVSETSNRSFNLSETATTITDNGNDMMMAALAFDAVAAGSDSVDTYGSLLWKSYEYDGSDWVLLDIQEQLETLHIELTDMLTPAILNVIAGGTTSGVAEAREGAIYAAQSLFVPFADGTTRPLVIGGTLFNEDSVPEAVQYTSSSDEPIVLAIQGLLAEAQRYFAYRSNANTNITTRDSEHELVTNEFLAILAASRAEILRAFGDVSLGDTSSSTSQAALSLQEYSKEMDGDAVAVQGLHYMATSMYVTIKGYALDTTTPGATPGAVFLAGSTAYSAYGTIQEFRKAVPAFQALSRLSPSGAIKVLKAANATFSSVKSAMKASFGFGEVLEAIAIGLYIGLTIAAGVNPGSPEFMDFLALQVATLYVTVLTAVIGATGIGTIVLVVIALIDLLIFAVCSIVHAVDEDAIDEQVDKWVCDGIMGAFTQALTYVIADYTPLVDLEKDGRLDMSLGFPSVTTVNNNPDGFVVGNQLGLSATITATLYRSYPNWMGYLYGWQLGDNYLDNASFDYKLQSSETDISLDRNQTIWSEVPGRSPLLAGIGLPADARFYQTFQPELPEHKFTKAGINQGLDVYLSEGFAMEAQNCWAFPQPLAPPYFVPVCWLNEYEDSFHNSLGNDFVFDILPNTLDGFHALAEKDDGYRLAWDAAFPVIADADNDGLRAKAVGGNDPNDSLADTDGDGLSDYYEVTYEGLGFDPEAIDRDCDGLSDYWEALYGTSPAQQDTDGDGLWDSAEMLQPNKVNPYDNSTDGSNQPLSDCLPSDASSVGDYVGGWSIIYDYDDSDNPIYLWVNASPTDPDSDNDTITDDREEVYGYHPRVASTLNVLSLDTEIETETNAGPYVKPNETIVYTATIGNELDNRYAFGLLQTEFPVDIVQETSVFRDGVLGPLETTTMSGDLTVSGVGSSQVTSMTVRAGAVIAKADEDLLVHLPMSEDVDETIFQDHSLPRYNFSSRCVDGTCPSAFGGILYTEGGNYIEQKLPSLTSFTLVTRFRTAASGGTLTSERRMFVFNMMSSINNAPEARVLIDGRELNASGLGYSIVHQLSASSDPYEFPWTEVALSYDAATNTVKLFVNGQFVEEAITFAPIGESPVIQIGELIDPNDQVIGAIDDFKIYNIALDTSEIRALAGTADVQLDLASTTENVNCSDDRCPTFASNRANFNQKQHLTVNDNALALTSDEFTFSIWLNPDNRNETAFDLDLIEDEDFAANDAYGHDTEQDWQGVFGSINNDIIYPSLFVSDAGRLRLRWGQTSGGCTFTSRPGLISYAHGQSVTVTFDSGDLVLYIDGKKIERIAEDNGNDCQGTSFASRYGSWDSIDIGRPNDVGYIYWDHGVIETDDIGSHTSKTCLEYGKVEGVVDELVWGPHDVSLSGHSVSKVPFDKYVRLSDDVLAAWFRWWRETDSSCGYNAGDYEFAFSRDISNISHLGAQSAFKSPYEYDTTLYWSLSNDFFDGKLKDFRMYSRALAPDSVEKLYIDRAVGLQMSMDEAPGQTQFLDSSPNNYKATCAGDSCPDSGIPGRANQALRFDSSGKEYLTLHAGEEELGLDKNFTVMAWIKPDSLSGVSRILAASRNNSINGIGFGLNDGYLRFNAYGVQGYNNTDTAVLTGEWTHVAVAYDYDTYDATFFVNGLNVGTVEGSQAPILNSDDSYLIGATTNTGSRITIQETFDGLIDDLRIYKDALGASQIQAAMNEAPLVNLHFDEDLNTTSFVNDAPNVSDATCVEDACPEAGDKGQMREAIVFQGKGERLTIPYEVDYDLEQFTLGLWVKPQRYRRNYQPLIGKWNIDSINNRNFVLLLNPNNKVRFSMNEDDCSSLLWFESVSTLLKDQWNHVVATFDGESMQLYINGALDSNRVEYAGTPCLSNVPITIGGKNVSGNLIGFDGNLDETTIQQGALSEDEVVAQYNYQSSWFDVKEQHEIRVDVDAPTIELDYERTYVGPGQIMRIAATDAVINGVASGIANVYYKINGGTQVDVTQNDDGCWCFALPSDLSGSVTISAGGSDHVGHAAAESTATYTIDTVAPTLSIVSPKPNAEMVYRATDELVLSGSVTDAETAVITNAVSIQMVDVLSQPVSSMISATVAGDTWQAVQLFETPPYGAYHFNVQASDVADNETNRPTDETPLLLDGMAPYADMATTNIVVTQTGSVFSGIVSDVPYPVGSSRLVHLHFEEATGATEFVNGSAYASNDPTSDIASLLTAICSVDACPTAGSVGQFGDALAFDGVNDHATIPNVLDPAETTFTAAVWFNAATIGPEQRLLLSQHDGTGTGRTWLGLNEQGRLFTFLGGSALSGGGADSIITPNEWHHAAVRYDGATLDLYLDGQLVGSEERTMEANDGDTVIGIHKGLINFPFAGNIDEIVIYGRALSNSELYNIANPLNVGIAQTQIRFRHITGAVWPNVDSDNLALYLPFDESAGTTRFDDFAVNAHAASCAESTTCPVAGAEGQHAAALSFDGVNDYLTVPQVIDPSATSFTAAAWFNTRMIGPGQHIILSQEDGTGIGRTWLGLNEQGRLFSFLGGSGLGGGDVIATDAWHHSAISYDGTTLQLYLDGQLVASENRTIESSTGDMLIGINKAVTDFQFEGLLDEVVLFDRALTADEVTALGISPWDDVTLTEANATHTTWSYPLDLTLEGSYKIDLYSTDEVGNSGLSAEAWTGIIDTAAPRLTFDYVPDADYRNAQVRCTADDEHLVEAGWNCPVDDSYRTANYQNAAWFTENITDTQSLIQLTTSEESVVIEPDPTMAACDLFGHCSEVTADVDVLEATAANQTASGQSAEVSAAGISAESDTSVSIYSGLQLVDTPIELSTVYNAFDAAVHTATWNWGDGTTSPASVDAANGEIRNSHVYGAAGIYAAYLNITEGNGDVVAFTVPFDVVVYDPNAGKTAGGGKIDSPAGAYKIDDSISGLADFNIPVDYQNKGTQPKGNFRFSLQEADLSFVADNYEWLIIYPDSRAMAKGTGTINGQMDDSGNPYHFWFWGTDSDTDTLRVRIWSEADSQYIWWQDSGGVVIYDNGSELPINNGNVQVNVSKNNRTIHSASSEMQDESTLHSPISVVDETTELLGLDRQLYLPLFTVRSAVTKQEDGQYDVAQGPSATDSGWSVEAADISREKLDEDMYELEGRAELLSPQIFLPVAMID